MFKGIGVEFNNNFAQILENRLNNLPQSLSYECINLSIVGRSPRGYLEILKNFGVHYNPDILLVGLFVGNDILESYIPETSYTLKFKIKSWQPSRWFLVKYLTIAHLVLSESTVADQLLTKSTIRHRDESIPIFSPRTFIDLEAYRSRMYRPDLQYLLKDPRGIDQYQTMFTALEKIAQICQDRNIELYLIIIPDQFAVDEVLRNEVIMDKKIDPQKIDLTLPNNKIRAFCRVENVNVLDFTDFLMERNNKQNQFLIRDTHLNSQGHLSLAEFLFDNISFSR
ncbi:MAG: SGNH/GDSL hydrolase family protein [Gemmatimonadota bacterium]|nr:SGNH/GDSL hydrolase family protein [Gemmatimonadota bacterium]